MENIETNVGALYHSEYPNTNPTVCLLPQHSVIKWDYPRSKTIFSDQDLDGNYKMKTLMIGLGMAHSTEIYI